MNKGMKKWKTLPNMISISFYTIIMRTLGGLLIGIWKKKYLLLKCHKNEIII